MATVVLISGAVCLTSSSCSSKKDKYYYLHQAIDLQKQYDEAAAEGDTEKMTRIEKLQQDNNANYKNALKLEKEEKETKAKANK